MTRLALSALSALFFAGTLAASNAHGAGPASNATEHPTHMYYFKERVELTVDPVRIAVRRAAAQQRPAIHGLGAVTEAVRPAADPRWELLTLAVPRAETEAIAQRVASALEDPSVAFAAPVLLRDSGHWAVPTPDILLQIRPEYADDADAVLAELAPALTAVERSFGGMPGAFHMRSTLRSGWDVLAVANRLAEDERIAWAEPDCIAEVVTDLIPNDTYFPNLWGIRNTGQFGGVADRDMDGDVAWDTTVGASSVRVLVLDSGVQQDHPDINQDPGSDFTGQGTGGGPSTQYDNHGTAVAGCVTGIINNGIGVVGIAPGCKVISGKFSTHTDNSGSGSFSQSALVNALNWGVSSNARCSVSSFSVGSSSAITSAYNSTRAAGLLHFASSGNAGAGTVEYPASLASVVAVGGITRTGSRVFNYGTGLDFTAPAVSIWTTDRTGSAGYDSGDYSVVDGTSFSCPYAAGCAALTFSRFPWMTADEAVTQLQSTAKDLGAVGYDTSYGWGIINANNFDFDCNANGTPDDEEIAANPALDCQPDTVLDECQLTNNDCNANGTPDDCELTDNDCNANGTPDDCELAGNDCNANNVPDDCESAALAATMSTPLDQTPCPGASASFTVSAPGVTAYRWYRDAVTPLSDGGNIFGAETATLIIDPVSAGDAGAYSCVVTSGCIEAESAAADLSIASDALSVTMVSSDNQSACASSGPSIVVFEVAVNDPVGVSYQWALDGQDLVDGGGISGATAARLEINSPTGADVGTYTCRVNNGCMTEDVTTSGLLRLSAAFAVQPPAEVCAEYGAAAIFAAQLADPQPDQFFWLENGATVNDGGRISGAHTPTLTLSNVQASDDGRTFRLLAVVNDPPCLNYSTYTVLQAAPLGGCPNCANPGDMDGDGDYDLVDIQLYTLCFGADVLATPQCACANVDASDNLITVADWIALAQLLGGPF